jgi:hypothetical protein
MMITPTRKIRKKMPDTMGPAIAAFRVARHFSRPPQGVFAAA